jgi:hypothetical protein
MLIQALINSDEAENIVEAKEIIAEMRERMLDPENPENPEELLREYGLEPDYVMDLLY